MVRLIIQIATPAAATPTPDSPCRHFVARRRLHATRFDAFAHADFIVAVFTVADFRSPMTPTLLRSPICRRHAACHAIFFSSFSLMLTIFA